ncbi:MAG: PAS domain S-box protein [Gemmataceae bacterium]
MADTATPAPRPPDATDRPADTAEERLRTLLGYVSDAVVIIQPDGRRLFVGESARRVLGYAPEEMVGGSAFDHIHPDDLDLARGRLADTLARPGGLARAEFRYRAADGRWLTLEALAVNLLDHPAVGGVLVVAQDVTERRRTDRVAREAEELYHGLFQNAAVGMAVLDGLRIISANPALCAMLGYTPAELIGQECVAITHPEDHATELPALREVLAGVRPHVRLAKRYVRKDGSVCWADLWFQAVRDTGGPHPQTVAIVVDRTEQRRLEEQFRQSQKMEALGQLAGGVAHDFNNLLTVIHGTLEMIALPADDPNRSLMDAVAAAAARAGTLTRKLLEFARRQPAAVRPVDLARVIADTTAVLARTLDPRIRLDARVAADLPPVTADPGTVQQALLNLCLNARDAMPDGGTLTVAAELCDDPPGGHRERYVRLTVADTGTGMPPEVKARIFEPFYTTKPVGQGTGLGLPMVDRTVRQFGGWVECESAPGEGTRFDLYLPAAPSPADTVLVVEDDDTVRAVAVAVLQGAGLQVTEAADATAAGAALARNRPAAIVLDLNLPDRQGADLLAAVRAAAAGVPIVVLSGELIEGDAPPPGAVAAVPKPFNKSQLLSAVRRAIAG